MHFHGNGRYALIEKEIAPFRVFHSVPETRFAIRSGQQHPQAALEKGMKVDHQIVAGRADFLCQSPNFIE